MPRINTTRGALTTHTVVKAPRIAATTTRGALRSHSDPKAPRVARRRFAPSPHWLPFAGLAAALLIAAAPAEAAKPCRTTTVTVKAGTSTTLRLDCRIGKRVVGPTSPRKLTVRPKLGTLTKLARNRFRYTARATASGTDRIRYRVARHAGTIRIRIKARPTPAPQPPAPQPPAPPDPAPEPQQDGLPARLPAVPGSVAATTRNWVPTAYDTCPKPLHERFSVVGPDGKRYPTWHPPAVTDPATGRPCTFGHEHGTDPRSSQIYDWAIAHFANATYAAYAGLPFGLAAEALNTWAESNATPKRSEDHVGYKVDVANDVALLGADGGKLGVTCDHVTIVHQGSHSPDALSNNVHELLYAVRCDDGTELITDTISRFGNPGEYSRSCEPGVTIATTDNGYPDGEGERLIPDRTCVERDVLVAPGETISPWALYEKWSSGNALTTPDDQPLARFDTAFGVFDPSRYAQADGTIARTLALCAETTPAGRRANGGYCAGPLPAAFDDPASPLDGTQRDVYLAGTTVANAGGPARWWTDPYGGNASPESFPGAVCQLVAPIETAPRPPARTRVFGRNLDHDAEGVHAPN
jgi:hypothetical protein